MMISASAEIANPAARKSGPSQADLGDAIGISQAAVSGYFRKGIFPAPVDGVIDIPACILAYCESLRKSASGNDAALASERTRLAREQADAVAMTNAKSRRDLLPAADVVSAWQTICANIRAKLLSIPTRAAPQLAPKMSREVLRERLTDFIHETLRELASGDGLDLTDPADDGGHGARGAEGDEAAAAADRKPVGRSKKKAKPRGKRRAG